MQRIYAHIGSTSFDPDKLISNEQPSLGDRDKPTYGLWASPFNDKNACQWEWFLTNEMNPNAYRRERALDDAESTRFNLHLRSNGLTRNQYYSLPIDQRLHINKAYQKLPPTYTKEEMYKARQADYQDRLTFGANSRLNAFYFTVDHSKILHIYSIQDVSPYIKKDADDRFGMFDNRIDFDKIKEAGYDGVELHNARQLRNSINNPFYTWDVDSIVIWNPDCIKLVPKEIAYMARSIADAKDEFDAFDQLSDDVVLARWLADNIPTIDEAIENNIFTKEEIAGFIDRAIELDNQRRGLAPQPQVAESQLCDEEMVIKI